MKGNHKFQNSIRRTVPSVAVVAALVFWVLGRVYEAGRKAGLRNFEQNRV